MRIIKRLYGLLVIVLATLIVLAGTWVPEALLEKRAESLSYGKTAVVDHQEITPYTYTMSVETRIPKLTDMLCKMIYETGLETGEGVRAPLDTELTEQQARDKTTELLLKLNEIYRNWGLDPMFHLYSDDEITGGNSQETAAAEDDSAGGKTIHKYMDAVTDMTEASAAADDHMTADFLVDEDAQQLSLWWICVMDVYDNPVYVALDAVTGLPVLVHYLAGYEASLEDYADAVSEAYSSVYGSEYTFGTSTVAEAPGIGYDEYPEYVVFTCEGKMLSLEYQYYFYGKDPGDKAKYTYYRPGEVMIWLFAS